MTAAKRRSRSKRLATLLGATCLALVAIPAAAQATTYKQYYTDDGLRILDVYGDDANQSFVLGCSGGDQTVNGQFFYRSSVSRNLYCNEIDFIEINGKGGNDTIDTRAVSTAGGYNIAHDFDFPRAPSHAVYLVGGVGNDTLTGGPLGEHFNDTNSQESGSDTIRGGGGNDGIWGTREPDKLFGDAGEDVINPEEGADEAHGGSERDIIEDTPYGSQRDLIFGEGGKDSLDGGGGPDKVDGGSGNDYMDGGAGKDRMFGRAGADGLFGSGGADFLFGNAGKDYLGGGPGRDKLRGGPGKDELVQGGL